MEQPTNDPLAHWPWCKYRQAVESTVGVECEHGYDVCPRCDPCTCDEPQEGATIEFDFSQHATFGEDLGE